MSQSQCDKLRATMADQYYVSKKERQLLEQKAARRAVLREEFQKLSTNPRLHGHGGTVFDHQLMRFQAMRVNTYEHFKPTPRNFLTLVLVIGPILLYGSLLKWDRNSKDHMYRTGQVAYKDRRNRFL